VLDVFFFFSCSLQFLVKTRFKKCYAVRYGTFFFSFLVIKTLDPDSFEILDPDPYQDTTNFNTCIYSGEYEPGAAGGKIGRCRRSQPAAASPSLKNQIQNKAAEKRRKKQLPGSGFSFCNRFGP
jgi:hypothetical protein